MGLIKLKSLEKDFSVVSSYITLPSPTTASNCETAIMAPPLSSRLYPAAVIFA
jgi:hypothetical protein